MELANKDDKENEDPAPLMEDELSDDLIMEGRQKIKQMYQKSNDKSEVVIKS